MILEKYSLILIMTLNIRFCRDMQHLFKNMVYDLSQAGRVGWHLYFGHDDISCELYPDYKCIWFLCKHIIAYIVLRKEVAKINFMIIYCIILLYLIECIAINFNFTIGNIAIRNWIYLVTVIISTIKVLICLGVGKLICSYG